MSTFEITVFVKDEGPLTKTITLRPDGAILSDGSACVMSRGLAKRVHLQTLEDFANLIDDLESNHAIALGALRNDLPNKVSVLTKSRLSKMNGSVGLDTIARSATFISYRYARPALALIDFDRKGMPTDAAKRIASYGGPWKAICVACPGVASAGHIIRPSTSAGLHRVGTREELPGTGGQHIYLHAADGADVDRFLRTLHDRCWLAGFGWMMVGAGGQLLERSVVDRMVGAPERLVFEGPPIVFPPLAQDRGRRAPRVVPGVMLDTVTACPPLTIIEKSKLTTLRAKEAHRLADESKKVRVHFVKAKAQELVNRTGMPSDRAVKIIESQCSGILLPDVVLPFDDDELAGVTVADVLVDPAQFEGATLADPLEGVDYGQCKAKIMLRADGSPWINSFAHGHTTYQLRLDMTAAKATLEAAEKQDVANAYVRVALACQLTAAEAESLLDIAVSLSGIGKRALTRTLKAAREQQQSEQREEDRNRIAAMRTDPRPQIEAPELDAPWLPQMQFLNEVLGSSQATEPPMRDLDGVMTEVRLRPALKMFALTGDGSNNDEPSDRRLPAPEQPLLTHLTEIEAAELIERYIEYIARETRTPVHLANAFVRHFHIRHDNVLPTVSAVATLPMILADGTILSGRGLDRERGIVFRVPEQLHVLLPHRGDCGPTPVAEAMQFLCDEWLCDVSTDYLGKCVIIAATLTVLERLLLPERPAFFLTAGQRGGGKTTTANMVSMAALGCRASAAAWSPSDEERRKALLAYLGEGVPLIAWDNISRGAVISCASIEKALTSETYTDRVLGVSENRTVPATSVHLFTGNNISARGDLASRRLEVRLAVDRPDPENRPFRHADPNGWIEANRGRILHALFTVMIGNPRLYMRNPPVAETRFKMWWHLIGSAIEHAAKEHVDHVGGQVMNRNAECPPQKISFRQMFLAGEAEEEQTASLSTVLDVLRARWPNGCQATELAAFAGDASEPSVEFKAALEAASGKAIKVVTATVITWRLKALVDAPVQLAGGVFVLRYLPERGHGGTFIVKLAR